jgi:hypothetical protein
MALGDLFVVKNKVSPSRLNAKTIHWSDATTLSNIPTTPCMVVIPTTTGSGFIKNQPRFRDADNLAWLILGMSSHKHDGTSDIQGGSMMEMYHANFGNNLIVDKMVTCAADWATKVSSGSSVTDDLLAGGMSRLKLLTSATANGYAMVMLYGITPDFGMPSRLSAVLNFIEDTSILGRIGVGAEDVNIANIITGKKYGVEVCDNAVEGKFVLIFSSDAISRTTTGSAFPIIAGSRKGYSLLHTPSVNIKMTVNGDDAAAVKKPSQIPSSGTLTMDATDTGAVLKAGVLGKAASAARTMRISGVKFQATVNDVLWKQSPVDSS